jgi:hypothetical protein
MIAHDPEIDFRPAIALFHKNERLRERVSYSLAVGRISI